MVRSPQADRALIQLPTPPQSPDGGGQNPLEKDRGVGG